MTDGEGLEPQFIRDQAVWDERWSRMPVFAREDALQELGRGRAASDLDYAPFAYLVGQRHRRGARYALALLASALAVTVGAALAAGEANWVALTALIAGLLALHLGGLALWLVYISRAVVERNAARLRGASAQEANREHPRVGWLRAVAVAGRLAFAYMLMLFIVRGLALAAWVGLQAAGVDVTVTDTTRRVGTILWFPVAIVLTWLVHRAVWSPDES